MSKKLQELEFLAQKFRRDNSLNENEPIIFSNLLQKKNILTVYRPLSSGLSGMSIKIKTNEGQDNIQRFMLINSNHSIGKQHFTICHELYHLYYQENFTAAISNAGKFDKRGDINEYRADMFAVYLLLPQWGVWNLIPEEERAKNKITIGTILAIEKYFACSHSALLIRLVELDLIDEQHKAQFQHGIKSYARKLGFDTKLYEPGNHNKVIGNYGAMAYKAWDDGIISESSYMSLMKDLGVDVSKITLTDDNGEE
ncbi:MAG: ImmA/IrrE family metallo-endopeptidase [Clostridiales bacterium]|nr:ImmA/IrrE family metallo-endopeptidase [Clostridiales bacterium]